MVAMDPGDPVESAHRKMLERLDFAVMLLSELMVRSGFRQL
jgi:hypothetical protein